jgi:hypothetical protein
MKVDVKLTVQDSASIKISPEENQRLANSFGGKYARKLSFGITEKGKIQLFLLGTEIVSSYGDNSRWKAEIVSTFNLMTVCLKLESHETVLTFVRLNIIRSKRILSFLKAVSPGPLIPDFWIGVRISLFQKQVCKTSGVE